MKVRAEQPGAVAPSVVNGFRRRTPAGSSTAGRTATSAGTISCHAWAAVQRGLSADRRIIERAFCVVTAWGRRAEFRFFRWVGWLCLEHSEPSVRHDRTFGTSHSGLNSPGTRVVVTVPSSHQSNPTIRHRLPPAALPLGAT